MQDQTIHEAAEDAANVPNADTLDQGALMGPDECDTVDQTRRSARALRRVLEKRRAEPVASAPLPAGGDASFVLSADVLSYAVSAMAPADEQVVVVVQPENLTLWAVDSGARAWVRLPARTRLTSGSVAFELSAPITGQLARYLRGRLKGRKADYGLSVWSGEYDAQAGVLRLGHGSLRLQLTVKPEAVAPAIPTPEDASRKPQVVSPDDLRLLVRFMKGFIRPKDRDRRFRNMQATPSGFVGGSYRSWCAVDLAVPWNLEFAAARDEAGLLTHAVARLDRTKTRLVQSAKHQVFDDGDFGVAIDKGHAPPLGRQSLLNQPPLASGELCTAELRTNLWFASLFAGSSMGGDGGAAEAVPLRIAFEGEKMFYTLTDIPLPGGGRFKLATGELATQRIEGRPTIAETGPHSLHVDLQSIYEAIQLLRTDRVKFDLIGGDDGKPAQIVLDETTDTYRYRAVLPRLIPQKLA